MQTLRTHWKKVVIGGVVLVGAAGATMSLNQTPGSPAVTVAHPEVLNWTMPTTDQQWADDNKNEQIDIRGTAVVTDMLASHTQRMESLLKNDDEAINCIQCLTYRAEKELSADGLRDKELAAAVTARVTQEHADAVYEVERIKQVVARLQNELRLRKSGFLKVIAASSPKSQPLFGASNSNVRRVIDK